MITEETFFIGFGIVFPILFLLLMLKMYSHWAYLKIVQPDSLKDSSFLAFLISTTSFQYGKIMFEVIIPYFQEDEKNFSEASVRLVRSIKFYCRAFYVASGILLIFIIIAMFSA